MSTVIFFGDTLWADTCVTNEFATRREQRVGRKLARHGNSVFGFTGTLEGAEDFMEWVRKGRPNRFLYWLYGPSVSDEVYIFEWDGRVLTYWESVLKWWTIKGTSIQLGFGYWKKAKTYVPGRDGKVFYMGSGSNAVGKFMDNTETFDPRSAIRHASKHDVYTNNILEYINLELSQPERAESDSTRI